MTSRFLWGVTAEQLLYDGVEEGRDGDEIIAACRGQKRRLHTVCEMSHAARSKMIKQLDQGIIDVDGRLEKLLPSSAECLAGPVIRWL